MTLHALTIPKWGLAMEEGTLTSWLIAEGDTVRPGDEVAEIETSKITNVFEAQAGGILRRRVSQEGDVKPVGALLGVLADAGEDDSEIDSFVVEFESHFVAKQQDEIAGPTAETVEVGGLPVRFLKVAAKGGERGTPLVLVHGFGGDHLNWMFNQGVLAATRDVYALDLPGHGSSTKNVGDGGLEDLAARLDAWLDLLGLESVHVVGHSMGAGVALALALANPARVKSLTAICGAGFGGDVNRSYLEGFLSAERRKDLKPVVELLFADPDLVTREMLEDLIAYKRIDGVPEALRALIDKALDATSLAQLRTRLGGIRAPLFAIFGAQDKIVPMVSGADLQAEILIVEEAGHMPHLEAPELVNRRIAAFVAAHD